MIIIWVQSVGCQFLLSWHSFCNLGNHTKVTVPTVICWFSPNHWDRFFFLDEPMVKINCTCVTTVMWSPTFVLIYNFAVKVMVVCHFNHYSYFGLLWCKRHFTINNRSYNFGVSLLSEIKKRYSSLEIYLTNVILEAVVTCDLWCKSNFCYGTWNFCTCMHFFDFQGKFLQIKTKHFMSKL